MLQDNIDDFHSSITRYSNTQTSVSISDYSTNNPFNQKLQELSRTIIAPDLTHTGKIAHWYYERVSGQYDQDSARLKTKAEKEKFKAENPTTQKFDKCELGKVYTAWTQRPDVSINGPQKCYQEFIKEFKDTIPDSIFFENFCAMLMMYRFMEKKNPVFLEYHQVKAQMTMYTLAMLYHVTNGSLSLYKIWQNQCLSEPLKEFINELSRQLYEKLMRDCPPTTTFRDFCKSPKTWEAARKYTFTLDMASIADDLKRPDEEKARKLASKSDNENERKEVESYGAAFWDGLYGFTEYDIFTDNERKIMSEIRQALLGSKMLTSVLVFEARQILKKFNELGVSKEEIANRSNIKATRKDKDSTAMFKCIQDLTEEDWTKIRAVVSRVCEEADAKIVKKLALQKDRSKLTFKQLTVVCRALDSINEKFGSKMTKTF